LVVVAPALEAEDSIKDFQSKTKMDYAVLSEDVDSMVAFGVDAAPSLYIVGRDGKIRWSGTSEEDPGFDQELEKALAKP
jgi:hypothetical protein